MDNKEEIKSEINSFEGLSSTPDTSVSPIEPQPLNNESAINASSLNNQENEPFVNEVSKEQPKPSMESEVNNIFPGLEPSIDMTPNVSSNDSTTNIMNEQGFVNENINPIAEPQNIVKQEQVDYSVSQNSNVSNVSLNGKEQVVYEYKQKKEKSIIPLLLFFLGVGALIIFLPNIQEAFTNFKNGRLPVNSSNNNITSNNIEPTKEPEEESNKEYYDLSKDTIISIDKLILSDFAKVKDNDLYYLTFNIENKANAPYVYKDNIYIQMYSSNELIGNALLEDTTFLPGTGQKQLRLIIPESIYVRDFQIDVKKISSSLYPEVELTTNLKDQQELSCALGARTILYTFLNNELIAIDDQRNESSILYNNIEEYNSTLMQYQNKVTSYNMFSGISSNITNNINGFSFYVKIDPNAITSANLNTINDRAYYLGKTQAKVISFEMKARGYTCK